MRFDAAGQIRADFVLNQAPWTEAKFLITGPNFGCGSSREHAVWGMQQLGIRCVIGASFGGIFSDNCLRNGVLALVLPEADVARLMPWPKTLCVATCNWTCRRKACTPQGTDRRLRFELDPLHKEMLLHGLDAVGMSLTHAQDIREFETRYHAAYPWAAPRQNHTTR
jgi:3-isopropylmalate/(R)-2-methylmalate dehydratase small subunit